MIRVLLVEDQVLLRRALAAFLRLERDIEVVGEAGDVDAALGCAEQVRPDVVLLDVQLPGGDGLGIVPSLRGLGCRVLILTTFGRPGYLSRAVAAGASGFVVKDITPERLVEAIHKVHAGLRASARGELAIVIELPSAMLTDGGQRKIGVWGTISR